MPRPRVGARLVLRLLRLRCSCPLDGAAQGRGAGSNKVGGLQARWQASAGAGCKTSKTKEGVPTTAQAGAPAHVGGQAERLRLRQLPRPAAAPRCRLLGSSAARHAAAIIALRPKHKHAAAPCCAGVRATTVLCSPLVRFECKRLRHGGRLGLHMWHAQLAAPVPQDALAAGWRGTAWRRGRSCAGLPAHSWQAQHPFMAGLHR